MKRFLILMLAIILAFTVFGCAQPPAEPSQSSAPASPSASASASASDKQITIGVVTKIIDPFFQKLIDNCVARPGGLTPRRAACRPAGRAYLLPAICAI